MAIYELRKDGLLELKDTGFSDEGIQERRDLQRLLREQVNIISPDTMVIAEEFSNWEDSKRRIDLLGLDKDAKLVVIELKRTETGGHMELQAIRYAAMVSTMTFQQVVQAHEQHLASIDKTDVKAETAMLDFLGWDEPDEDEFAKDVRIVLASGEFSKEITSAVMWLNERDLDIRCVRLRPYKLDERVLVDIQQVIPLPEAAEYQVRIREKTEQKREARQSTRDYTKYDLTIAGERFSNLPKNQLAYYVFREAIHRGIPPERLLELIAWKRSHLLVSLTGELDQQQFIEKAIKGRAESGRSFDSRRYFTSDDRLIRFGGETCALTNKWGPATTKAVDLIIRTLNASDINYERSV